MKVKQTIAQIRGIEWKEKKRKKTILRREARKIRTNLVHSEFKSFGKDDTLLPGKKTSPPYASASERAQANLCESVVVC